MTSGIPSELPSWLESAAWVGGCILAFFGIDKFAKANIERRLAALEEAQKRTLYKDDCSRCPTTANTRGLEKWLLRIEKKLDHVIEKNE